MKIKYNKSPIYNIILFVFITVAGLFEIVSFPILSDENLQYGIVFIFSVGLFLNAMINTRIRNITKTYSMYFYAFLIYLAVFIIVHCFYGAIHYDEGLKSLYAPAKFFGFFFLFVPLIYTIHINNGYEQLLRNIAVATLIIMAFKTLKAFAFNFAGINILNAIDSDTRYSRLRMGFPVFGPLVFMYFIDKILNTKINKRKYYLYLAIIAYFLFYLIYINMTRMNIIGYILTLAVMILFRKRPKNKQIVIVIAVAFAATVLLTSNIFENFVATFSETDAELGVSTIARNNSNEYFKQFPKQNLFLGMGFLSVDTPIREALFSGAEGVFHLDDLGIKNMYYHYGITGIILAVLVLGRMLYIAIYIIFFSESKNKLLITGITVFITFTQPSLCIFDGQRMTSLILYWAIFEYEYAHNKKIKQKFDIKNILSRRRNISEQQQPKAELN